MIQEEGTKEIISIVQEIRLLRNNKGSFDQFKKLMTFDTLNKCNVRWLTSCVDTFFDYGTLIEQSNAGIIISLINMIKVSGTVQYCSNPIIKKNLNDAHLIFDSVNTLQTLPNENTCKNYSKRIIKCLKRTPKLFDLFLRIHNKILQGKNIVTDYMSLTNLKVFYVD